MKYVKLNNGVEMPMLGFGVYQISDEKECEQCVYDALMAGYRLIDTAAAYKNEKAVGKAIKRSGIPRSEIFVTTKVWIQDYGYENTKKAFQRSMDNLGLDYLDLYLLHHCMGDAYDSWRALEDLYKEGKIRAIGVSNFWSDRLVDFCMNNKVVPAVNQIEIHPFFQRPDEVEVMKEYGVQAECWAPFAEGLDNIFQNETLNQIGRKHNKSAAQVILRWNIQRGVVAIPKSSKKERIEQNIDIWDFELTDEEMESISKLDTKKPYIRNHRDPNVVKVTNGLKIHD